MNEIARHFILRRRAANADREVMMNKPNPEFLSSECRFVAIRTVPFHRFWIKNDWCSLRLYEGWLVYRSSFEQLETQKLLHCVQSDWQPISEI